MPHPPVSPSPAPRRIDDSPVPFWSTIWSFVKPQRAKLLISIVCAVVVGVTVSLQPITVKWIVDNGILRKAADGSDAPVPERLQWALFFAALYALLSLVRMTVGVTGVFNMIEGVERFLADLRARFFNHVQSLSFGFHDRVSSGELFNYIMGSPLQSLKQFLNDGSLMIPLSLVSWCVTAATLVSFNWAMALITLCTVTAVVLINRRSARRIRTISTTYMDTESSVSKYVADVLRGSRAVKIYAITEVVTDLFSLQIHRIRGEGERLSKRRTFEHAKAESVQYAGMAIIYGTGAWLCIRHGMQVGTLFAFIVSVGQLMGSLMSVLQLNLVKANAEAGLTRIVHVLRTQNDTPEPGTAQRMEIEPAMRRARSRGLPCLELRDVQFGYDPARPVIRDISCVIADGQSVALVGPSGSGKTTLVSLLLRLYDVGHGGILLNGYDLRNYRLTDLRSSFGVVPQDPYLFQGSILDNVKVIRPDAREDEVLAAMEIAHMDEFVRHLPQGVHTQVGEGGASLSGGQRQRVAIARAVLARAHYYIFDEATSALDNESELRIQSAMERLIEGHTSFIIAHRLSTVRNVNRILVFQDGRIVQDGAFAELSGREGVFNGLLASAGMSGILK